MFSSDEHFVQTLDNAAMQINRSFAIFIFIFGNIGNILNCLVLSNRSLRSNPCAFIFLVSSLANIVSISVGVPTRILAGWNRDPTSTSTWLCKCRAFFVFTSRTIAFWLIVLATFDRWLLSSVTVRRRQMSSLNNVRKGILIITLLSIALYLQMFYCYEANRIHTPLACYGKTMECRLVTDLIYSCLTIFLPVLLTVFFGLMTVSNIRQVRRRVTPTVRLVDRSQRRQKKLDQHLLVMLFVEVIISISLTLPQAIEKLYSTFSRQLTRSNVHNAIDNLIYDIVLLLSFLASGMPFYIYTLAGGNVYRNRLRDLFQNAARKVINVFVL